MTLLAEPLLEPTSTDEDDDLVHIVCCDPTHWICGLERDPDEAEDAEYWEDDEMCQMCQRLEDMPCSDPNCPDRRPIARIRRWLGR